MQNTLDFYNTPQDRKNEIRKQIKRIKSGIIQKHFAITPITKTADKKRIQIITELQRQLNTI